MATDKLIQHYRTSIASEVAARTERSLLSITSGELYASPSRCYYELASTGVVAHSLLGDEWQLTARDLHWGWPIGSCGSENEGDGYARFTGSEIHRNAAACAKEILEYLETGYRRG